MIFALLLSREDEATRNRQWQLLQAQAEPPLVRVVQQLSAPMDQLPAENRLSVVDMTIPALKRLSPAQYQAFRQIVEALTAADGKVDLFEYCLRVILFGYLDVQFGLRPAPAVRYKAVSAVAQPAIVILSALAYAGQSQPDDIQRAFQAGAHDLLGQVQHRSAAAMHVRHLRRGLEPTCAGQPGGEAEGSGGGRGLHRRGRQDDRRGERAPACRGRRACLPAAARAGGLSHLGHSAFA